MGSSKKSLVLVLASGIAIGTTLVFGVQAIAAWIANSSVFQTTMTQGADDLLRKAIAQKDETRKNLARTLLHSKNPVERCAALEYFTAFYFEEALPFAREMYLRDTAPSVVHEATRYLTWMCDDSLAVTFLDDPERIPEDRRAGLAYILGATASAASQQALRKLSEDDSATVREQAYVSLWGLEERKYTVRLYFRYLGKTPVVRLRRAVFSLAAIGDERCENALRELTLHGPPEIRELAARQLNVLEMRLARRTGAQPVSEPSERAK